jgi:hypothetical protein
VKVLVLALFAGLVAVSVAVPLAVGGSGNATCPTATSAANDLVVPAGATCTLGPTDVIGHDLIVQRGATLIDLGAAIGHDIHADSPAAIGIGSGGRVGHDIQINGTTGTVPGGANSVCNTTVGHDLVIQGGASGSGPWVVGDFDEGCFGGGVLVQHDLNVQNNKVHVDVSDNGTNPGGLAGGVGHDLNVQNNLGQAVESNVVGHDANCQPKQTAADKDGDGIPNLAGHSNNGCA